MGGMDSYCFDPNRVIGRKENRRGRGEQMDLLWQEIDKRGYPFRCYVFLYSLVSEKKEKLLDWKRVGKARFQVN